jgi:hypothetical protein
MTRIPISIFVSISFPCECVRLPDHRPARSRKPASDLTRYNGRKRSATPHRFIFQD